MFDILAITAPIYIAIALGYGLTRWGFFQKADMRAFGTFVVKVAMPALLFNALSQRKVADILNGDYVGAYALASLLTIGISIFWAVRISKTSRSLSSCLAMGMSCPNSGFVGYPVMLLSLGPLASVAGVALALNMMVENLLLIPLLLAWAETGQGQNRWQTILVQTLKGMIYNPMIWGIVFGFAFSWFEWQLTPSLSRTVNLFAQAAAQGNVHAQFNLGVCYERGDGIVKNSKLAVEWYAKAAAQDYHEAQNNLGVCYMSGKGVAEDYTVAAGWFAKGAAQGHAQSQHNLGMCYAYGVGVAINLELAASWRAAAKAAAMQPHAARSSSHEVLLPIRVVCKMPSPENSVNH